MTGKLSSWACLGLGSAGLLLTCLSCEGTSGDLFIDLDCAPQVLGAATGDCQTIDGWTALATQTCAAERLNLQQPIVPLQDCGSERYRMIRFDCCMPPARCEAEFLDDPTCLTQEAWTLKAVAACQQTQWVLSGELTLADACGDGTTFQSAAFRCCLPSP